MAGKRPQPSRARTGPAARPGAAFGKGKPAAAKPGRQQVIPEAVANRMVRRIAVATGLPSLLGMGVFIASYLLVSRQILYSPPGGTLAASGA